MPGKKTIYSTDFKHTPIFTSFSAVLFPSLCCFIAEKLFDFFLLLFNLWTFPWECVSRNSHLHFYFISINWSFTYFDRKFIFIMQELRVIQKHGNWILSQWNKSYFDAKLLKHLLYWLTPHNKQWYEYAYNILYANICELCITYGKYVKMSKSVNFSSMS